MSLSFSIAHALPETILAIGALVLILVGAIRGEKSAPLVAELAIGVLALALIVIFIGAKSTAAVFDGAFIDDQFARYMKVLVLIGSLVTLVLSRDFLLEQTRGREAAPFDRTIDVQVGRLRRKIEADPERPELIKSVRGAGYVLIAAVTAA